MASITKQSATTIIKKFFGYRPTSPEFPAETFVPAAGSTLQDFQQEIKALGDEDKFQLASAAAKALNIQETDCAFALVAY